MDIIIGKEKLKMKCKGDKLLVKFTKESIESIYLGKEIQREDGSKVRLFITVDSPDDEDRKSTLFVQTAIVMGVGDDVRGIEEGDIAILNYDLINMKEKIFDRDETGVTYWLDATTTYHHDTLTAYANRQSARDQIVYEQGDYDCVSLLLGIIRDGKLIARDPFIFIDHESAIIKKATKSGIIYEEKQRAVTRKALSISPETTGRIGLKEGDKMLMLESDVFEVKMMDKSIDCVYDIDVIGKIVEGRKYPVPL